MTSQRADFPCEIYISDFFFFFKYTAKVNLTSYGTFEKIREDRSFILTMHIGCLAFRGKDGAGRGGDDVTAAEDEEERKGPTAP